MSEQVTIEQPDGTRINIPEGQVRQVIEVVDPLTRSLAVGALAASLLGLGGVGFLMARGAGANEAGVAAGVTQQVDPALAKEFRDVEYNFCLLENVVKIATGYDPEPSVTECREEWDRVRSGDLAKLDK